MKKLKKINIAVFCSGNGTNLQAIINAVKRGALPVSIAVVVSDNKDAFALARAKRAGIPTFCVDPKRYAGKQALEALIIKELKALKIDLIVLAGFMRLLSADFISCFRNRIINIHPALLPAFKGAHGIRDAFAYGVKVTGVTVHFVDEMTDHGPIIMQEALAIRKHDTLASLEKRIHAIEHTVFPQAIRLFAQGRLAVHGRKVSIS